MRDTPCILLVDDDVDAAQAMAYHLERAGGYRTAVAGSGPKALECVRELAPDLVVLDVRMPGMSGYEVCETLKSDPETKDIPVVFVTARTDTEAVVKGLELGADDYIGKPYPVAELLARVRVMLRLRSMQQRLVDQERLNAVVEMAGAAAHELNQPLTVLQGNVELLQRQLADQPAALQRCARILDAAAKLTDIVRRMGGIRRYRTRRYVDDVEIIDLSASADRESEPPS